MVITFLSKQSATVSILFNCWYTVCWNRELHEQFLISVFSPDVHGIVMGIGATANSCIFSQFLYFQPNFIYGIVIVMENSGSANVVAGGHIIAHIIVISVIPLDCQPIYHDMRNMTYLYFELIWHIHILSQYDIFVFWANFHGIVTMMKKGAGPPMLWLAVAHLYCLERCVWSQSQCQGKELSWIFVKLLFCSKGVSTSLYVGTQ